MKSKYFQLWISAAILSLMTLSLPTYAQWGASASIFSDDGVELKLDARLISLFVMLNKAGYDSELEIGPEPLNKPMFSEMRKKIRVSKGRVSQNQINFEKLTMQYPKSISYYIDSVFRLGKAPEFTPAKRTKKLTRKLHPLIQKWYAEEGGSSVFQTIAFEGSKRSKPLIPILNIETKAVNKLFPSMNSDESLLEESVDEKSQVVLTYNPLDMHRSLFRLKVKNVHYVVYGPSNNKDFNSKIISATTLAYLRSILDAKVAKVNLKGTKWQTAFNGLSNIDKKHFRNSQHLMSEVLVCVIYNSMKSRNTCDSSVLWKNGQLEVNAELLESSKTKVQAWLISKEKIADHIVGFSL